MLLYGYIFAFHSVLSFFVALFLKASEAAAASASFCIAALFALGAVILLAAHFSFGSRDHQTSVTEHTPEIYESKG